MMNTGKEYVYITSDIIEQIDCEKDLSFVSNYSGELSDLKKIEELYIREDDTSITVLSPHTLILENNSSMLFQFSKFHSIDLRNVGTSNVTDMSEMFGSCEAKKINLGGWDIRNVTDMSEIFYNCAAEEIDLSGWDTSNLTDMSKVFYHCQAKELDLSGWNTHNVTSMEEMFSGCKAKKLNLKGWDTGNVTNMGGMFFQCKAEELDLSGWDTKNVTKMDVMFHQCEAKEIDLSGWDTGNVTDMGGLFSFSAVQNLDLSRWNTKSVTDMCEMFMNCKAEVINLGEIQINDGILTEQMFSGCEAKEIKIHCSEQSEDQEKWLQVLEGCEAKIVWLNDNIDEGDGLTGKEIQYPKAYEGNEPYIFISYAHKNSERIIPIISALIKAGYRIWYDDGIDPGTEWDDNIAAHVEECQVMIAFISEAYMESDNCKDELSFARELNKERLLIYLEEVELTGGLRMRLGRNQAIYMYSSPSEDVFMQKLLEVKLLMQCKD